MNMKFKMGAETLTQLTQQTSGSHDDLGALVKRFFHSAEAIEKAFNGNAKAVFNTFKSHTDDIADELNAALASVLTGVDGQNRAFIQGEQGMIDDIRSAQSGAAFDAARFRG
jgi:uncharacterized protein YukE